MAAVGALILLALATGLGFLGTGSASSLVVDPSDAGAPDNLQEALDQAGPGAHIRVKPGTYAGGVVVDKSGITIVSDDPSDPAVFEAPDGKPALRVTASQVTVADLRLQNSSGGLLAGGADGLAVRNLSVQDVEGNGIAVNLSEGVEVDNVSVTGATSNGLRLASVSDATATDVSLTQNGRGLHAFDAEDLRLGNVTATDQAGHGIVVEESGGVEVAGASTGNTTFGVWVLDSSDVDVLAPDVNGTTGHGLLIQASQNVRLAGGTVEGAGANGLLAKATDELVVDDLEVEGSRRGVHLLETTDALVADGAVRNTSEDGIVAEFSSDVTLRGSTVTNASKAVWLVGSPGTVLEDVTARDARDDLLNLSGSSDVSVRSSSFIGSDDDGFNLHNSSRLAFQDGEIRDTSCDVTFRGFSDATFTDVFVRSTNNRSRLDGVPDAHLQDCPVETVHADNLDGGDGDWECDDDEWHFVITHLRDRRNAPASIHLTWADGSTLDVALDKVTGRTAHYSTTEHLDETLTEATTTLPVDWDGRFNLSHGPCHDGAD